MVTSPPAAAGVQIAVDVPLLHLDRPFTYRVPPELTGRLPLGARVKVPFGGRRQVDGWVVGHTTDLPGSARDVLKVVSAVPAFDAAGLAVARWVADRYAASLADTFRLALPPRVAAVERGRQAPPDRGDAPPPGKVSGLVERLGPGGVGWWRPLPGAARGERLASLVTAALDRGLGAIVVVPEVTTSSTVADALRARVPPGLLADFTDLTDRRRYRAWLDLAEGRCRVALGGRSVVFAPVRDLGLIIVDDEANQALKETRTPRYHAREVALERTRAARAVCLLTGTVPSAETVAALAAGRIRRVAADRGRERRAAPLVEVVDPDDEGPAGPRLHPRGLRVLREALARGESAYVLVPRRGAAVARPPARRGTRGSRAAAGPANGGGERVGVRSAGQVAAELARVLPGVPVWRLDRDVVEAGEKPPWADAGPGVVVGTVAGVKDSPPLPGCRTVVVVAADAALGQAEVRAAEEALRTWSRAAVWCGPRGGGGRMVLQARTRGHHAVQALVRWDADHFWRHELPRRAELGFPPARSLMLVEGPEPGDADAALALLTSALGPDAELLGPAAMGKGWRIIAKVDDAETAARTFRPALVEASRAGTPLLSVDVDPLEVLAAQRQPGGPAVS